MTRKKAVKVRKWVTCAEPGCKRRAGTSQPYCGEHQKKFEKEKAAAAAKRRKRRDPRKPGRAAARKAKERLSPGAAATRKATEIAIQERAQKLANIRPAVIGSSRLIKAQCEKCEYTIRLSRKWIEVKRPICPVCMRNMITAIDSDDPDPRQLGLKGVKKGKADPKAAARISAELKGGV